MVYFLKESEDVLFGVQWPYYTGFTNTIPENTVTIENKGLELALGYSNSVGELTYNVSGNLTYLQNEVTSLGDGVPFLTGSFTSNTLNSIKVDAGQPVGSFYGFVLDGIYQSDAEAAEANDQKGSPVAADLKFRDIDGDGDIDDDDQQFLGSAIPKVQYGLNITLDYKSFDLSMFFNGLGKHDLLNGSRYRGYFDFAGNYFADALNGWTPSNTNTEIPRNTVVDQGFNRRMSRFYLENGAYFRLRNVQLGYSLPSGLLDDAFIRKLRVYVSAQNLFTLTNYTGSKYWTKCPPWSG